MKLPKLALLIVLCCGIVLVADRSFVTKNNASLTGKETAYERILRTETIRCGYTSWNPLFYIDPSTGNMKGIFHDMMEETGRRLGLKIVWQEEIGWGSVVEAVKTGRVDMACSGYWLNPARIRSVSSSAAQLYTPIYAWGRQDDKRIFKNMDDLNSDQMTVVSIDGSAENQTVAKRFPRVKSLALPELDTNSDELESLLTHKADFIVLDSATTDNYIVHNPGKIRNLFPDQPLVVFPNVMLLPPEEPQLKEMIDDMMHNIEYDGTLDAILSSYGEQKAFLRNAKPTAPF